jgi:hypothetical protein
MKANQRGDEGNRTPNPCLANAVLCQLSYVPRVELQPGSDKLSVGDRIDATGGLDPQIFFGLRGQDPTVGDEAAGRDQQEKQDLLHMPTRDVGAGRA